MIRSVWHRINAHSKTSDWALLMTTPYFIPKKRLRDVVSAAAAQCPDSGLMVDVGCGYQPYRHLFPRLIYFGIDTASERRPTLRSEVEAIPLVSGSADVVICTEVLEHTREPLSVLREIRRVAKPEAKIIITAPMSWNLHYEPNDFYRFTPYGLAHMLRVSGCAPIFTTRIGGFASLCSARCTDVLFRLLMRAPLLRGREWSFAVSTLAVAPLNLLGHLAGRIFDSIDGTDAIGWMVVASIETPGVSPQFLENPLGAGERTSGEY